MLRLETLVYPKLIANSEQLGIAAMGRRLRFAWLAKTTVTRQHANLVNATGARETVVLGAVYYV